MTSICPALGDLCLEVVATLLVSSSPSDRQRQFPALASLPIELLERLASDDLLTLDLFPLVTLAPLERVILSGCTSLPREVLQQLVHCTALRHLELARCGVDDSLVAGIAAGCTNLRHIDLSQNPGVTQHGIVALTARCTGLDFINLLKCRIELDDVTAIADCKKLRKLNLGWCRVEDVTFGRIAKQCTLLEALELWLIRDLTGAGIELAAPYLTGLKKLSLWATAGLSDNAVQALAAHCRVLESVNFQANHQLSDAAFIPARPRGGKYSDAPHSFFGGSLQKLVLSDCLGISALAVRHVILASPLLKKINLASVSITDREVAQLADMCQHLMRLDLELTDVSSAGLRRFAYTEGVRNLRTLNLHGCASVDDDAAEMFADYCSDALRKVHLVDCQVTDKGVKKLLTQRSKLHVLSLGASQEGGAHSLTDDSLILLQRLVYLRKLALDFVDITDVSLVALFTHCLQLKSFTLSLSDDAPTGVTNTSMSLLSKLRNLSELTLEGVTMLADFSVASLVQHCTRLSALEFASSPRLTTVAWAAVADHAARLRTLTLGQGIDVTAADVNEMLRRCTRLVQVDLEGVAIDAREIANPRPNRVTVLTEPVHNDTAH